MSRASIFARLGASTLILLAVGLAACSSPQARVARRAADLGLEWQTNLVHQIQRPERILDWPAAVALLRAHNLKLRQVRTDLTNAQEQVRQVFRDLVPTLNLHAGANKRLVDLPEVGGNDIVFSADTIFSIPGVVNFNARLYLSRLYLLRAEAAYALSEREQIIELYKLFWAAQDAQEQARQLQSTFETARAFEAVDPFTGQLMRTQADLRELSERHEGESLQQRAADLLGSHQSRWLFATNGLPELPYDLDPLPLGDTNRVAQLQIRLAAIELEAARAELAGLKLRYWPELNIFITGPPLYQRAFGEERFWDARDVRASADVFWWIDTRGYIARQIRQTKRQRDLQAARLRQDSLTLMDRLLFTQDLLKATLQKEQELAQQLAVLEAVPPAQNYAALQKYATDFQVTADQLRQVRHEAAELKALFWFVDEARWEGAAALQPLVAAR
ncbi:MAG: hypothetical protein U1G07_08785 [Verrucomicrobiota bacterium]